MPPNLVKYLQMSFPEPGRAAMPQKKTPRHVSRTHSISHSATYISDELPTFPTRPDEIASLSSAGCMHCSAVTPLQRGAGAGPPAQPDSAEPLPMIQKWKHGRSTGLSSLGQVDILAYLYCSEVGSGPWTRRRIALYCYRLCNHSFLCSRMITV